MAATRRSIFHHDDYRAVLREELAIRNRHNPRYSQRAFARDLELKAHRLSEILSGKQGLSGAWAARIAAALGYGERETEFFCRLVESRHSRSRAARAVATDKLQSLHDDPDYFRLEADAFACISEWYHLAIMELSKLVDFRSDTLWIAKALGITANEAGLAVERLERLRLIRWENGRLSICHGHTITSGGAPSDAIKSFHQQVLEKAGRALFLQPLDRREFTSVIVAIDPERLPEVKRRLRNFWAELDQLFESDLNKIEVYCLSMQFYSLMS